MPHHATKSELSGRRLRGQGGIQSLQPPLRAARLIKSKRVVVLMPEVQAPQERCGTGKQYCSCCVEAILCSYLWLGFLTTTSMEFKLTRFGDALAKAKRGRWCRYTRSTTTVASWRGCVDSSIPVGINRVAEHDWPAELLKVSFSGFLAVNI